MKIKPNKSYRMAGYKRGLIKNRIYNAIEATNIPGYKAQGLVFCGDILLNFTEYTIIK